MSRNLKRSVGFTLIEVMVAIAIMAMIAILSWRAIDGMGRTQQITQERGEDLRRVQSALGQWGADLDAVFDTREVVPIDFNGRVLRMTRRDAQETGLDSRGVRVVAWALIGGPQGLRWSRWQSAPLRQREELARAWQRAAEWGTGAVALNANPGVTPSAAADSAIALLPVSEWQVYYHLGESWSNPQSTQVTPVGDENAAPNANVPNGVRLVISLGAGQALTGTLTRDWVRPTLEAAP